MSLVLVLIPSLASAHLLELSTAPTTSHLKCLKKHKVKAVAMPLSAASKKDAPGLIAEAESLDI
jgi:hypothetical protein